MRRYRDDDEVDLLIVGCGAGGCVLAQRLARAGWRIVILERGPFWDPDRDWVSDEAGSAHLYWTDKRIIGGERPGRAGQEQLRPRRRRLDGALRRLHAALPPLRLRVAHARRRRRRLADLLLGPEAALRAGRARAAGRRAGLAVGRPAPLPARRRTRSPAPPSGRGPGARAHGIEMRVGPVAITNGVFGNRPHCIYRGFCLQGCKVNAKASPLVTHLPDAIEHGVEIRADSMAVRVEIDEAGRCTGVTYVHDGRERFQRAAAVAVCGYSIETPRLLLNSTSPASPPGSATTTTRSAAT